MTVACTTPARMKRTSSSSSSGGGGGGGVTHISLITNKLITSETQS
jgi:hypothetical protein